MSRDDECQGYIEELLVQRRRRSRSTLTQGKSKELFDAALRRADRREQVSPAADESLVVRGEGAAGAGRVSSDLLQAHSSRKWQNTGGHYEDAPAHELEALPEDCDTRRLAEERREREAMDAAGLQRLKELEAEGLRRSLAGDQSEAPSPFECALRRADRRASTAVAAEGLVACSTLRPDEVPLDVTFTAGCDPREDDAAFQGAPAAEQDRVRAAWADSEKAAAERELRQREAFRRTLTEGTLLFAILGLVLGGFLGTTLPLMCCGPVAGLLWHVTGADRIGHAWIGMALYGAVVTPFVVRNILGGGAMTMTFFCLGAMLTGYVCSARGLRAEMRAREGF